jgi:CubicO group peptidase (beta-lactamase class C family)
VVQQLVIDATGESFPKAMAILVLSPLAMNDSTYEQPLPEVLSSKAATGHDSQSRPIPGKWNTYPEMAAAGLWTTASDLARYVLAVQRAYSGQRNTLIERDTAREMLRPQIQGGPGLGLFVSGDDRSGGFSHIGINNGYKCMIVATKSIGRGLVIMTNSDNGDRVYEPIQQLVRSAFARDQQSDFGANHHARRSDEVH